MNRNEIEKREDGFWCLNGVQKKGACYYKLNEGDIFMLCGVVGKGRREYLGKVFEYQFFTGEIE